MKHQLILELASSPLAAIVIAILTTIYYLFTHWRNGWVERVVRVAKCFIVALITYSVCLLIIGKITDNMIIRGMLASGIMGVTVSYSEAFFDKVKAFIFSTVNKKINDKNQ